MRGAIAALAEAARTVAGPGHRSVGTVGGNLCLDTRCVFYNQSAWWRAANAYCLKRGGDVCHVAPQGKHCHAAFAGDLAPALLALDAEVELVAGRGVRRIPLADLYRDDGAAHLTLACDEVLARVFVPASPAGLASGYRKARTRGAIDFPLAGVACALALRGNALSTLRIALTGTNSRPIVLDGTAAFLGRPIDDATLAALRKLVQKQASPMRTTVTSSDYRRQVAAVLAQRLVRELGEGRLPMSPRIDHCPRPVATATLGAERHATPMNAAAILLGNGSPQHPALVGGGECVTYNVLQKAVARAAGVWRQRGVAPGDRVAIKLPDGSAG